MPTLSAHKGPTPQAPHSMRASRTFIASFSQVSELNIIPATILWHESLSRIAGLMLWNKDAICLSIFYISRKKKETISDRAQNQHGNICAHLEHLTWLKTAEQWECATQWNAPQLQIHSINAPILLLFGGCERCVWRRFPFDCIQYPRVTSLENAILFSSSTNGHCDGWKVAFSYHLRLLFI